MIAFASNSLLCRLALKQTGIDAATFTLIRIVSGPAILFLIAQFRPRGFSKANQSSPTRPETGSWISAFALFIYAAAFSFAYNKLAAGTGALLLFGAVQATMIFWGFHKGERFRSIQIVGLIAAIAGLIALLLPGITAPPLASSILMLAAGIAWGIYSLRGKAARNSTSVTAGNFVRAIPFAITIVFIMLRSIKIDRAGVIYAVISGAVTSGLGYVIWYKVLSDPKGGLGHTTAATVQLSVPVLAATGGILLLREPITLRYVLASIAVLGGILLVIVEKNQAGKSNTTVSFPAR